MYYANYWELVDEPWIERSFYPNSFSSVLWLILLINHFPFIAYWELYRVTLKFIDQLHQVAIVLFLYLLWNFGYLVDLVCQLWSSEVLTGILITSPLVSLMANRNIRNRFVRTILLLMNVAYFSYQRYFGTAICLLLHQFIGIIIIRRLPLIGLNFIRDRLNTMSPVGETFLNRNIQAFINGYYPNFLELAQNYYQNDQSDPFSEQIREQFRLLISSSPDHSWQFLKTDKLFAVFTPISLIMFGTNTPKRIQFLKEFKIIPEVKDEDCAICKELFSSLPYPILELGCQHRYCSSCLCNWIITNKSCPLCRVKLY